MSTNEEIKPNQKEEYCQPLLVKHGHLTDITSQGKPSDNFNKPLKEGVEDKVYINDNNSPPNTGNPPIIDPSRLPF